MAVVFFVDFGRFLSEVFVGVDALMQIMSNFVMSVTGKYN